MSKTLNIKQIESGLNHIRKLGHMEDTFKVLGHKITLRTIRRSELEAANRYCRPLFEEAQESEDTFTLTNWLQAVKRESLTYAVMAIDDIDFHGIEFVSTGKIDPETGHEIRVQKHVFVRELLDEWEDAVLDVLFKKFQELTEAASNKAKEGVEFKEEDDKIQRIAELEAELAQLRDEVGQPDPRLVDSLEGDVDEDTLDHDSLKEQVFSPMSDEDVESRLKKQVEEPSDQVLTPREREARDGDYIYAEGDGSQSYQQTSQNPSEPQTSESQSKDEEGPRYVDEEYNPLTGEELEIAKENERLYQQRQAERAHAQALKKKRRKPMNQVNARVRQGNTPGPRQNPEERPTVNANKVHRPDSVEDLPVASGFTHMEPESLAPTEKPDWDNAEVNKSGSSNVNPNFQPPNQRKK